MPYWNFDGRIQHVRLGPAPNLFADGPADLSRTPALAAVPAADAASVVALRTKQGEADPGWLAAYQEDAKLHVLVWYKAAGTPYLRLDAQSARSWSSGVAEIGAGDTTQFRTRVADQQDVLDALDFRLRVIGAWEDVEDVAIVDALTLAGHGVPDDWGIDRDEGIRMLTAHWLSVMGPNGLVVPSGHSRVLSRKIGDASETYADVSDYILSTPYGVRYVELLRQHSRAPFLV